MADELSQAHSPAAVTNDAAPIAPIVASPAPADPAPSPIAADASPIATVPTPAESASPSDATLLGEAPKPADGAAKPEEKSPETKPDGAEAQPEGENKDGGQSEEPAPLPTYDDAWTFPEGLTPEAEKIGQFNTLLGEFERTTKADSAEVRKFGQSLVDYHVAEVTQAIERLQSGYQEQWARTKDQWKSDFIADSDIGGNRQETTVAAAREFIETHGGTPEQKQEFRDLMQNTGIGNHKAMIRMLALANMAMREGKPLPAAKPMPDAQSKVQKRYGTT